jgi:hypothetical protein
VDADEITEALAASRGSLAQIGDGDWTPQDHAHALLLYAAEELLAQGLIARSSLSWIAGFCESLEDAHTGFKHVRRQAQLGLGEEVRP